MPTPHDIGPLADYPVGVPHRVEVGGRSLVLLRTATACHALHDRCPHQGARLSAGQARGMPHPCAPGEESAYERPGQILVCPWHGWEYDAATGCALVSPERYRIRRYPAYIRHGRVVVEC